jgi:hypothetical protein
MPPLEYPSSPDNLQSWARLAGVLSVLTVIGGGFGEAYVPSVITGVGGRRRHGEERSRQRVTLPLELRRLPAGGAVRRGTDTGRLGLVRPVHRTLALGMVVFRIISTCGFAAAMMLWFGALSTLKGSGTLAVYPREQLDALVYALLRISGFGRALFSMFYGVANVIFAWLIYRSAYIPRLFGVGFAIMGIGFTLRTFLLVLAPTYVSPLLLVVAGWCSRRSSCGCSCGASTARSGRRVRTRHDLTQLTRLPRFVRARVTCASFNFTRRS